MPRQALLAINLWYGNPLTSVLLVDTPLPEGEWTNLQPYGGRGWCRMEQRASAMVKDSWCLISLSQLTGEERDWDEVIRKGKGARPPPMSPAAFAAMLEEGVASGEIKFTNSGDVGLVCKIYERAFLTEMGDATGLSYFEATSAAGVGRRGRGGTVRDPALRPRSRRAHHAYYYYLLLTTRRHG